GPAGEGVESVRPEHGGVPTRGRRTTGAGKAVRVADGIDALGNGDGNLIGVEAPRLDQRPVRDGDRDLAGQVVHGAVGAEGDVALAVDAGGQEHRRPVAAGGGDAVIVQFLDVHDRARDRARLRDV